MRIFWHESHEIAGLLSTAAAEREKMIGAARDVSLGGIVPILGKVAILVGYAFRCLDVSERHAAGGNLGPANCVLVVGNIYALNGISGGIGLKAGVVKRRRDPK